MHHGSGTHNEVCEVLKHGWLFAAAILISGYVAKDVTPLQKVVSMMDDMIKKGTDEKHKEEVTFNVFKVWCVQIRKRLQS